MWQFKRGEAPSRSFAITDANGDPVNLNAAGTTTTVHISRRGLRGVVVLTVGSGITLDVGDGGTGTLALTTEQSNSLSPSLRHQWDLEIQVDINGTPLIGAEEGVYVHDSSFGTEP